MRARELAGTWAGIEERPFVGIRFAGLARYAAVAAMVVASLMFYVWSRSDVRASAGVLESREIELARQRAEQDRLRLELAARQDLAQLARSGKALGLSDEVRVVEVVQP